jgi:glycosyltransferase involved in cell wall biosynthesis
MRVLFVADGRSSHTRRWLAGVRDRGHDVHLLTYHPIDPEHYAGIEVHHEPLPLRAPDRSQVKSGSDPRQGAPGVAERLSRSARRVGLDDVVRPLWTRALPILADRLVRPTANLIRRVGPDVVHALRLPVEGYVASAAWSGPLVVSSWGADLVYFARRSRRHAAATRRALGRAAVFVADCRRDVVLARARGLSERVPTMVLPGSGGILREEIPREVSLAEVESRLGVSLGAAVSVYARGYTPPFYAWRQVSRAATIARREVPQGRVAFVGAAGNPKVERSHEMRTPGVLALPFLDRDDLLDLLSVSRTFVSVTTVDGISNTLLEAMAVGAIPVASDLEPTREVIDHGTNGLLVDPRDVAAIAAALVRAATDDELRSRARPTNADRAMRFAEQGKVMDAAEDAYRAAVDAASARGAGR